MTRVYIVVEGQTEESFVNEVLASALTPRQIYLFPLLLRGTGGNTNYARVQKDVLRQLKQDPLAYCSTMLDFYGLGKGFPGTPLPLNLSNLAKVTRVEEAMKQDIVEIVADLRPNRFIPYLQLHEYEGLLFSDPAAFARGIGQPSLEGALIDIRKKFTTPEDINDSAETAPSRRVLDLCPGYRKPLYGALAALEVGIETMRRECPHFREWLERLEHLGA